MFSQFFFIMNYLYFIMTFQRIVLLGTRVLVDFFPHFLQYFECLITAFWPLFCVMRSQLLILSEAHFTEWIGFILLISRFSLCALLLFGLYNFYQSSLQVCCWFLLSVQINFWNPLGYFSLQVMQFYIHHRNFILIFLG